MADSPAIPNSQRGEIEVEIGEKKFVLEPSMQNIEALESGLGKSFMKILGEIQQGKLDLTSSQAATFVYIAQKDPKMSFNKIRILIHEHGALKILPVVSRFVNTALTGSMEIPEEGMGNEQAKENK